jgi:predicted O-methyltransferase YrrM
MAILTDFIIEKAHKLLKMEPEPSNPCYSMFNTGSVEIEVGEFLYSLVRMQKPDNILETGTHKGISTLYMALALKDNEKGVIETVEFDPQWTESAKLLWETFDVEEHISFTCQDSTSFEPGLKYDLVLLDTEPHLRFDELVRFYPSINYGGIILIHDLGVNLSVNFDTMINNMYNWPFGDFRTRLGDLILKNELTIFNIRTPRGLTIMQKFDPEFSVYKYLQGKMPEGNK